MTPTSRAFGAVSQESLVRFVDQRIGDKRIIPLIQKWLRAGILEDGVVTVNDRGTGQSSVISPLLGNLPVLRSRPLGEPLATARRHGRDDHRALRDDVIVDFEREVDARRFLAATRARLEEFALSLHRDKAHLIEFGRLAATN